MAVIVEEGGYVVLVVIIIVALLALLLVFGPWLLKTNWIQSFISGIFGG